MDTHITNFTVDSLLIEDIDLMEILEGLTGRKVAKKEANTVLNMLVSSVEHYVNSDGKMTKADIEKIIDFLHQKVSLTEEEKWRRTPQEITE